MKSVLSAMVRTPSHYDEISKAYTGWDKCLLDFAMDFSYYRRARSQGPRLRKDGQGRDEEALNLALSPHYTEMALNGGFRRQEKDVAAQWAP